MCKRIIGRVLVGLAIVISVIGILAHFVYASIAGGWEFSENFWADWHNENISKKHP